MKVLNIHRREINKAKHSVLSLFATLSQKDDRIWPLEKWPAMKFKNGLNIGSEGGHGPIRYKVLHYDPTGNVEFEFKKPDGYNGIHKFEITDLNGHKTEVKHTIEMETTGLGTISWLLAIRWLHDALVEDAFDKMENHLCGEKKKTEWTLWVKILRSLLK